jgi:hypothetical protein
MGFVWETGTPARAVDVESFAEVVYDQDSILVINVARGLERDPVLADALMDVIATRTERDEAEWALGDLAGRFGLAVSPTGSRRTRQVTITPAPASVAERRPTP